MKATFQRPAVAAWMWLLLFSSFSSTSCAAPVQLSRQEELVKLGADVLAQVDVKSNRQKALKDSQRRLEASKGLPVSNAECSKGVAVERFNMGTQEIRRKTKAPYELETLQLDADLLSAQLQGRKDYSLKATDWQAGEPVGKLAELLVSAEILRNAATDDEYIAAEVQYQKAIDACLTEDLQRVLDQSEIVQNNVSTAELSTDAMRVKSLMARVTLQPLLESREKLRTRIKDATQRNPEAAKLRARAEGIAKKVATPELLKSREALAAAWRKIAASK